MNTNNNKGNCITLWLDDAEKLDWKMELYDPAELSWN